MDISRQIKQGISTGEIVFGQRETISACARGDARLILVAANCPQDHVDVLASNHPNIPVHHLEPVDGYVRMVGCEDIYVILGAIRRHED